MVTSNGLRAVDGKTLWETLWSNVMSHSNNKTLQLEPFIMHLKSHKRKATRVFFLSLFYCFDNQLSKFSQVCYLCIICWDTPSENTGYWRLPKVSKAFNNKRIVSAGQGKPSTSTRQKFLANTTFRFLLQGRRLQLHVFFWHQLGHFIVKLILPQ